MKKRIIVILMLMSLIFVACGKREDAVDKVSTESIEENMFYDMELSTFEPWESEEEYIPEGEIASEQIRKRVNELGNDAVEFINNTYHTEWENIDIDVFTFEGEPYYGGSYCHTNKTLYINRNYKFGKIEDEVWNPAIMSTIAHEMIHAATDANRGTPFFYKWYSDDSVLGGYLHEALTELLTEEYLSYIGIQLRDVYEEGMCSGYVNIVYYLRALDSAVPGSIRDILCDNMSELEEKVEKKAGNDEAFDRWLFLLDITQIEHFNITTGEEDAINPFVWVITMTEFMEDISDEKTLLREINSYFDKVCGFYENEKYCDTVEESKKIMNDFVNGE